MKEDKYVKMKKSSIENFWLYVKFCRQWELNCAFDPQGNIFGKDKDKLPYGGLNAIKTFILLESQGIIPKACQQPILLSKALKGKRLLNFQIKQWAKGYWDCGGPFFLVELVGEYSIIGIKLPEWVLVATKNQAGQRPDWWLNLTGL